MKAAVSGHADVREVRQSRVAVYSDDAARGAGRQEITISGGELAMVLVVGKVTYVKGNEAALTGYLGFPSAADGRLVNRWISFRPGNTGYQELTSGVMLAGLAGQLELAAGSTIKAPGMVAGRPAVGVHGTVPASLGAPAGSKATLYVAASGRALPVGYRLDRTGSLRFAVTFSRWGERCTLLRRRRRSRSPRSRSDRGARGRASGLPGGSGPAARRARNRHPTAGAVTRAPRDMTEPLLRISPHVDCTPEDLTRLRHALLALG